MIEPGPTFTPEPLDQEALDLEGSTTCALAVTWSREEPGRVGEVLLPPPDEPDRRWVFGRGEGGRDRILLHRQRPGKLQPAGVLNDPTISREQLRIRQPRPGRLEVERIGRCPLRHDGVEVDEIELRPGDMIELRDQLQLLCVERPAWLAPLAGRYRPHPFGLVDDVGLVGESPALWSLRRDIAFAAPRDTHVLILGASGTGKELVARAIHALSARSRKPLVARNAATFPETLIDAELFGNVRNYPNAGMPERPGLIGEAHGSTLFLDEIGELPSSLQAHLLRVLDQGEYQRLGESQIRRADLRLVAATNRPESALKHDFLARMRTRIQVPDLNERREDIPQIARHLVRRIASADPAIARRFLDGNGPAADPRFTPALMRGLVQHQYTTNVRELEALLYLALSRSPGTRLDLCDGMELNPVRPRGRTIEQPELSPEEIQAAIDAHHGNVSRAFRSLGLSSRYALYRLIRKHGLVVSRG